MRRLPQIRLQTLFVIFFCAAIGMTCASAPEAPDDPSIGRFGIYKLNLHYALLSAAATGMVIGLLQQAWILFQSKSATATKGSGFKLACLFAICWRVVIAVIVFGCLLLRILNLRQVIQPIKHEDVFFRDLIPGTLLEISVIVVLIDCLRRWQVAKPSKRRIWIELVAWIFGLAFALIVLPDSGLIVFLIHVATDGIEKASPLRFHRPDAFPSHQLEHFQTFWMSFGALIAVVLAMNLIVYARTVNFTLKRFVWIAAIYAVLAGSAGAHIIWFYRISFPRISPDMASVGFASGWLDWLGGGMIIAILTCAAAYRLAADIGAGSTEELEIRRQEHALALHESVLCLAVLFAAALVYLIELIRQDWNQFGFFGPTSVWEKIVQFLRDIELYPTLAISILSVQLCWIRWRSRQAAVPWELHSLNPRRFFANWVAIGILAVVALPTFAIYCFTFWMGPWYFYGPK